MKYILYGVLVGLVLWFATLEPKAATIGKMKYEPTEDRIVVTCVDHTDPTIRLIPRPTGGAYAVIECEKSK